MQAEYVLNGDDAVLRVCSAHQENADFAVVILDWKMPGKDGLETTREIRRAVGEEVPIIILSAYDWADIEQEAILAGVNAFIEKPLFKSRLTHVLKDVLVSSKDMDAKKSELKTFSEHKYEGKRVLLVEDNELNVEVASEILSVVGLKVDIAYNGKEAVELVLQKPDDYYQLIFMDVQMPVMNGYDAARAIRQAGRKDSATIPIIAMTADAFAEDVAKARDAGMNGHIAKPIDIARLNLIIREWIR
jgi:CheY-like chemotaxis protein